ncbi:MAG: ATP-binding cassette domain-containing protein [Nitriliruptorales bacterium]|nr:ATP-binding cassette domain-containing protein [Nitriliruptorales bacterium]
MPRSERLRQFAFPLSLLLVALAVPGVLGPAQLLGLALAGATIIALLSLNALLGYAGQVSLGQAAFVGTGGYIALHLASRGVPLPVTVLLTGLAVAVVTALVGIPSLRIKGLAVAVATLVYGIFAQQYLFEATWFNGGGSLFIDPLVTRGDFYGIWVVTVVCLVLVIAIDISLLRGRLGRAFVAVREAEDRTVAFAIEPGRTKLAAYAYSGFLAGVAGALVAYQVGLISGSDFGVLASLEFLAITVVGGAGSRVGVMAAGVALVALPNLVPPPDPEWSPFISAIALILVIMYLPAGLGGIGQVSREFNDWHRRRRSAGTPIDVVKAAVSAPLLVVTSIAGARRGRALAATIAAVALIPAVHRAWQGRVNDAVALGGGFSRWLELAALASLAFMVLAAWWSQREPAEEPALDDAKTRDAADRAAIAAAHARQLRQVPRGMSLRMPTRVLFEASNVSVRFGGVQALSDIDMEVRTGEIVGLIGANGAGKSTFYNVVSGFVVPEPGSSLRYRGRELLATRPANRTTFGIARTFQHMGLVRPQTVEDNVLLAQSWLADYNEWAGVLRLGATNATERDLRRRAELALEIFDLNHLRDAKLGSLPYGTMRMVELASAVATGADLLFFDEASAGLGPEEAHGLADRFLALRAELGLTLVVIEHHVPLIARVCDYVYCLASGLLLAEGEPASVQTHPDVVAEFLGRSRIEPEKEPA